MKIRPTKTGFNVSHTTREVWGVDDPSEKVMNTKEVKSVARQLKLIRPTDELAVNQWKQAVVAVAIGFDSVQGKTFNQQEFCTDAAYGNPNKPPAKKTKKVAN